MELLVRGGRERARRPDRPTRARAAAVLGPRLGLLGASLALTGGVVYTHYGKATLALGATALALAPVLWIGLAHRRPPAEVLEAV